LIVGVGVDLVAVDRMERLLNCRWAQRFISRVFSGEEIAVCERSARPAQCYAARFAAKEALAKALGIGFSRGVTPAQIAVRGGERSRPQIELNDAALDHAISMDVAAIHVSLSHTPEGACAVVVLEKKD